MRNHRLLWQLFPANLLITLGAVLILSWAGSTSIRQFYFDEMRNGLESKARIIEQHVVNLLVSSPQNLQRYCKQAGRKSATRITVIKNDGTVLADSSEDPVKMDNHANRPEMKTALKGNVGSAIRFSRTLREKMLYVAVPLISDNGRLAGALRMSVPVISLNAVLHSIHFKVVIVSILVVLAAAFLTMLVARRLSRPLEQMKQEAEQMAQDETVQLLSLDSENLSEEVSGLVTALNRMARKINERMKIITLQRNELETVFSSMTEMVIALSMDKKILRINRSAAALFYLSPDDIQGKLLHGVIRNKNLHEIVDEVIDTALPVKREFQLYVGPDRLYLHTSAVPLQDEKNTPVGVLVVMNDTTRLHKLENLRRDFVSNVSHELKTPITSIQGYVETLLEGAIDNREDAGRFLEIIARQSSRLDAIIDDLLTLSRIEQKTDQHNINLTQSALRPLLDSTVIACRPQAEEKNIHIEIQCPENLTAGVNPNLIEQAVINLLKNAIMYSPQNSHISLKAYQHKTPQQDRVVISVKDQGIGIASEHHERLFERFYRCDKGRSKELGGTGLGLSIVKHIAMAHGGTVSVQSQPGQGSIFSISLPRNSFI